MNNEYDKEQLKENLIRLEEKFRNGQIGEADYRTTKEKYQSMLYEYDHSKVETNSFKHEDDNYSGELRFFGFFLGGWIGYLFRPSIKALGFEAQLPFDKIIEGLTCNDTNGLFNSCKFEQNLAYASVEYIITGAILGAVIGWVVGKLIKR